MADNAFLHLSSWEATFEEASSQGALVGDIFGALFLLSRDGEAEELSDESLLEDFLALSSLLAIGNHGQAMANVSQDPCEAKESKLVLALVLALALALVLALELVLFSPVPFSDGQSCNPGSGLVLPPWPE